MTTSPTAAIVVGVDGCDHAAARADEQIARVDDGGYTYVDDPGSPAGSVSPNRSPGGDDEGEQLRRP